LLQFEMQGGSIAALFSLTIALTNCGNAKQGGEGTAAGIANVML
jgi:hypothetical protein